MLGWGRARRARQLEQERRERLLVLLGEQERHGVPSWQRRAAVGAAGMSWRHRVLLAPLLGILALWASGAMLAQPDSATPVWMLWLGYAAVWWPARWRRLGPRRDRGYAGGVWTGALLWLLAAHLAGVAAVAPALVVLGGAAAVPWWWRHRPRPRPADPPEVADDSFAARWDDGVGAAGKAAPGSFLADPEVTEHYTAYRLVCVPGAEGQTVAGLNAKMPRIASGTRTPQEQLIVERHPVIRDPSQLLVKHLTRSPAREVDYMRTPDYRSGVAVLGHHTDRDGTAGVRVYGPDSMYSGAFIAGSGMGKSREIDAFVITMRSAWAQHGIPTATIYIDGQSGASSPALFKHATVAAGLDEVDDVLDCLDAAARARQAWNRHYGLTGFTPGHSPEAGVEGLTGLLVVVDECHAVAAGRGKRFAHIGQERRKIGQGLFISDQLSGLNTFGNEEGFRSSVFAAGNVFIMRIASRSQGNLVPGLSIHPADLPAIPGYTVKVSTPESGDRTAPFRARYLPSAKDRADGLAPEDVATVEEWFERTEDAPLDAMTAKAFEPLFAKRAAREAARAERDRRLMAGEPLELEAPEPTLAGRRAAPWLEDLHRQHHRQRVTAGPDGGTVLQLLSGLTDRPSRAAETARAAELAVDRDRRPARERIPDLLRSRGPMSRQQLADELGISPSAVSQALRKATGVVSVGKSWDIDRKAETA